MLHPAGKKRVRTGAMELGKMLTLDLDPSPYCARQARGRTSAKELGNARVLFSTLCLIDKKEMRMGAMELGKVLTPESRLLDVVPDRQEAGKNRCHGIGQGAYPCEPPPPCCAQQARSG
jgi:hypothetical protein